MAIDNWFTGYFFSMDCSAFRKLLSYTQFIQVKLSITFLSSIVSMSFKDSALSTAILRFINFAFMSALLVFYEVLHKLYIIEINYTRVYHNYWWNTSCSLC